MLRAIIITLFVAGSAHAEVREIVAPNRALQISGGVVLGASWIVSAAASLSWGYGVGYIPVFGPIIEGAIEQSAHCNPTCENPGRLSVFYLSGISQAAGWAMLVAGSVSSRRYQRVMVVPSGNGIAVMGRF